MNILGELSDRRKWDYKGWGEFDKTHNVGPTWKVLSSTV